jgi:hypothetical protein
MTSDFRTMDKVQKPISSQPKVLFVLLPILRFVFFLMCSDQIPAENVSQKGLFHVCIHEYTHSKDTVNTYKRHP